MNYTTVVTLRMKWRTAVAVCLVVVAGVSGAVLYVVSRPKCLMLRDGNVAVKVEYSDYFYASGYPTDIRLHRTRDPNSPEATEGGAVLDVSSSYYQPLDQIISFSLIEPGPKYQKATFNGHDAAFSHNVDKLGVFDYYSVPFGNRVVDITYHPTGFTKDEEAAAGKMLRSMTLTEGTIDLKTGRVEKCST